jgi:hypothetical protein
MRDTNENMIELIDVSRTDNIYTSLIRHKIANEVLYLRFGIEPFDFGHLKKILEFRPFENTGVAPYHYFFALAFRNDPEDSNLVFSDIRVEQINRHKQYEFKISKKYIANILWFNSLTEKAQIEQMIENKE